MDWLSAKIWLIKSFPNGCLCTAILYYKANGAGTGLGLSLSYDIIKAHGGEIRVETKEGEGG